MIEEKYGGNVPVDLEPIVKHVATKLMDDIERLTQLLHTNEGFRQFAEQRRLLSEIQAGIRAADIFDGKVAHNGETKPTIIPAQNGEPPKVAPGGTGADSQDPAPQPEQAPQTAPQPDPGAAGFAAIEQALTGATAVEAGK